MARTKDFLSYAARINYFALDRPDLMYGVKELMRKVSCPSEQDWTALKHVARYLLSLPRAVMSYR